MYRLGGRVLSTEHARMFSRRSRASSSRTRSGSSPGTRDVIVLRHTEEGGAARAARVSRVPVINAGDGGGGQHPTQALLDLYTIYRERRALDGLTIAIVGELDRGRTARSLAYLLSKFERVKIHFVSPPEVQMRQDILDHLDEHDVWYDLLNDVAADRRRGGRHLPDAHPAGPRRRPGRARPLHDRRAAAPEDEAGRDDPAPAAAHGRDRQGRGRRTRGPCTSSRHANGLFIRMALLTLLWDRD